MKAAMKIAESRILCGTDLSPNAREAGDVAAVLARRSGAALELVHVAEDMNFHRTSLLAADPGLKALERRLRLEASRLRRGGVEVTAVLVEGGWAEDVLAKHTAKRTPAMVVVSAVSKTAFDRWTLGSVSESLAENLPVPVIVVRDAEPFLAWQRRERPLRVLAAIDLAPDCDGVLRWLAGLMDLGDCAVTLGFAARMQSRRLRAPLTKVEQARRNWPRPLRMTRMEVERRARRVLGDRDFGVKVRLVEEAVDRALLDMAATTGADLFVTGMHQWHGLNRILHPSISRQILRHAHGNVACVPAGWGE